jgi:hypothetical protein
MWLEAASVDAAVIQNVSEKGQMWNLYEERNLLDIPIASNK